MPSAKGKMINVRLTQAVHDQFKIACDLRGVSMSSLLHQFIVRTIREERDLEPKAFEPRAKESPNNYLHETADGPALMKEEPAAPSARPSKRRKTG